MILAEVKIQSSLLTASAGSKVLFGETLVTEIANEIVQTLGEAGISPRHAAYLKMGKNSKSSGHLASLLYFWLSELFSSGEGDYPGATLMCRVFQTDRQCIQRAEKLLVEWGMVTFSGGRKYRTFQIVKLTADAQISQDQALAYHQISRQGSKKTQESSESSEGQPVQVETNQVSEVQSEQQTDLGNNFSSDQGNTTATSDTTEQKPVATKRKLTPEVIKQILQSHQALTSYILFGQEAILNPGQSSYPPSAMNWTCHISNGVSNEDKWTIPQWMGFFWWQVSYYRDQRGLEQNLPIWSRLSGDLSNLLKQMTATQLLNYIQTLVGYFDVIKWACGQRMSSSMYLDATSLTNPIIAEKTKAIMGMDQFKLSQLVSQYQSGTGVAQM